MNQEKTAIGPWLFWSLITIICFGFGYINTNTYNVETMGANGYWAIPLAAVCTVPGLIAVYFLMKRFPNHNVIQQGTLIMGNFFGRTAGIIYLLFLLVYFIVFTTDVDILVHSYLLDSTPFYILCAIDLIITVYLSTRGIETISRIASFVILPLVTIVFLLFSFIIPEIRIDRLMPIFDFRLNFKSVGGPSILHIFYPMGLWALITPYCHGIHQKIPRMTLLAFLVLICLFLVDSIVTIGIYGHTYISQLPYPSIETFRTVEISYIFIEQAGLFGVIVLLASTIISSGFSLYAISLGMSQVLGLWDYKRFVWILTPLIFITNIHLAHPGFIKSLSHLFAKHGWMVIWGYPILLSILAFIFKKKGKTTHGS